MTPHFGEAARTIIGESTSSTELAGRAAHECERFGTHLARLLGEAGIDVLLKRSVVLASNQFPWLASGPTSDTVVSTLRDALEQQDPDSIAEAFVGVLTALVGLLERLIGEGLVERLLEEVWPTVFSHAAKDTP